MREITKEQADAVFSILVQHAGQRENADDRYAFVYHVTDSWCREYRFGGLLGWGGKFRNNGNHDNTPYVDCYQEHLTPERQATIDATNAALAALFN